ncbi:hypothetical protein HanRHA438_Chr04g0196441 [Helianthus annuus]|uniref:Uncharacterized protein n=1 Tax=Helianthus annuus TaxID=4232 RepID=A0A9K3JAK4_HELAN|nr:uncharacterized protein LOC110937844 [Helianthus annuus]KAF5811888.1 hypothetical protein HanXRQr2_Chr04g0186561 [Helianthus annuus]KAJ0759088.1 hypothetical protein HanLR1_Chr04g0157631 [Helianthus annuus]KAJ0762737.1 hypothetical protein HanOQP8_Chr04g0164651 [Helianthus annuus]KAJ0928650.1 hypothetical protein HanRHA438_Chr04g0196441 [Helianthus annuus]
MGCCVSTKKHPPSSKLHQHPPQPIIRTPPPPVVDVETVKEVYSETPNLIKPELDDPKTYSISRHNSYKYHTLEYPYISEIASTMNDNISTTSFDDDVNDVYRRKVVNKSPSKSTNRSQLSGELPHVRKSPVRGKEQVQSPGRVKLVPQTGFGASDRRSPARSRSPAKRTAVRGGGGGGGRSEIGRSLSGRMTGKSPGRVGSDLHERVRKPELRSGRGSDRFTSVANKNESLDNPLVSLECFIFL